METKIRFASARRSTPRATGIVRGEDGKRIPKIELATKLAGMAEFLAPGEVARRIEENMRRYTAAELASKIERRESFRHTQRVALGTVVTHDFQADIYGGQFEVIAFDSKTGTYTAKRLAPSAEVIGKILEDVERGSYYVSPGQDRWEEAEKEIQQRESDAGTEFQVKFVSAQAYAEFF